MDSVYTDSLVALQIATAHQTNMELRTLAVLILFAVGAACGVAFIQGLETRS